MITIDDKIHGRNVVRYGVGTYQCECPPEDRAALGADLAWVDRELPKLTRADLAELLTWLRPHRAARLAGASKDDLLSTAKITLLAFWHPEDPQGELPAANMHRHAWVEDVWILVAGERRRAREVWGPEQGASWWTARSVQTLQA